MTINYTALKAELLSDPNAYGYAPLIAAGNDVGLAALLNEVRAGITIRRRDIAPQELLEAIDVRDFTMPAAIVTPTLAASWLESALQIQSGALRLLTDAGVATRVKGNLDRLLGNTQGTQDRLNALAVRTGSRAEQLFGTDTRVTHQDIATALRQTP